MLISFTGNLIQTKRVSKKNVLTFLRYCSTQCIIPQKNAKKIGIAKTENAARTHLNPIKGVVATSR